MTMGGAQPKQNGMGAALTDALRVGLVALLIFGPMTGLVLNGYGLDFAWQRTGWLVAGVFFGRLAISLALNHGLAGPFLKKIFGKRDAGVVVARVDGGNPWLLVGLVVAALILPFFLSKYWLNVAALALIYVLLGLGLNIVVGLAGLLDLGFVAFYAVGAYGYALGHQYLGLGFWGALPFGAFTAACFGVMLGFPVLRMHGDYLAIVTLGFGEIIRLVLNNWMEFTGGPNGIRAPYPSFFGLEFTRRAKEGGVPFHQYFEIDYSSGYRYIFIYLVLFIVVVGMIFFLSRLRRMPIGRAWEALREDEIACRSLGINHVMVKLSAFAMGAMVGGIGGVFFAASQGFVNPTSFTFFESALILAIVVLGGMGSTRGVIIAALVLTILPELLRDFSDYRGLMFGIAMVVMMVWRPRGFLASRRSAFSAKQAGEAGA
ncbi:MAG: high-affinity branched-chain amino acid ABC transporter permease LivM [Magnetococcales bacterium]|nr:high-affinity branched-chain amino acid ABC transporter permease LivM [Magnetococcales bacterium]